MSGINRSQFDNAATQFFRQNPKSFEKYYSPTLLQQIVDEAVATTLPTVVGIKIVFDSLVADGDLRRTDNKTEADDADERIASAQQNLDETIARVQSAPLSKDELDFYAGLSARDLSDKYFENGGFTEFRYRYDLACEKFGFRTPLPFAGGRS